MGMALTGGGVGVRFAAERHVRLGRARFLAPFVPVLLWLGGCADLITRSGIGGS